MSLRATIISIKLLIFVTVLSLEERLEPIYLDKTWHVILSDLFIYQKSVATFFNAMGSVSLYIN